MLTRRPTFAAFAAAALLVQGTSGMYAEDVGKLDWHTENLGRFVSAGFDGHGGVTVVGEASTIASINSRTGKLTWRRVLAPEDIIIATSNPSAGRPIVTLSSGERVVRLWSPLDGSLTWETALVPETATVPPRSLEKGGVSDVKDKCPSSMLSRVVSTEAGHTVVLSPFGIHVLSSVSGIVLAQWWSNPSREPDLAALVGADTQVTFTSLRPLEDGTLLAGGWTSPNGVSDEAVSFISAEIRPTERLVTFKAAKVSSKCKVKPSDGVTLVSTGYDGGRNAVGFAVVGLCSGGTSLVVYGPSFDSSSTTEASLPNDLSMDTSPMVVSRVSDLSGSNGYVLELHDEQSASTVAVTLSSSSTGAVSVIKGSDRTRAAWSCPPMMTASSNDGPHTRGCALTVGVSPTGKAFVASVVIENEPSGKRQLVVRVSQLEGGGDDTITLLIAEGLSSLGQGLPGRVVSAFLEAAEGVGCAPGGRESPSGERDTGVCLRALVVNEDDSAMMVGSRGLEWVREEALAAVENVVFVDTAKDELALLAVSGHRVEHHVPDWTERLRLQRLEVTSYLGAAVKSLTGLRMPGSELLDNGGLSQAAFGFHKIAICTTKSGKLFALDMTDGSIVWSIFLPLTDVQEKILLHATRPKGALGYNPEISIVSLREASTTVSWRDAVTGVETKREEKGYKVISTVPLEMKDVEERYIMMIVDSTGGVHAAPSTPECAASLFSLLPKLYHHSFSEESGLESFAVTKDDDLSVDGLSSSRVASVPLPRKAKLVAKVYPDRRDTVQTPAQALGDDSLLIKYINPRMLAFATLGDAMEGGVAGKGQDLTVTLLDHVSGRILYRVAHKGAAEPVHMAVSESWVVYTYWSVVAQRYELSTLSLCEGMIDRYGLSPFNRPAWKEAFSSFESKVPIVMQKTFIFPHPISALGTTVTQHGITAKDIIVGTTLGQVILLDRRLLDPRRPVEEPTKIQKEEKLLQYQPFLPVVPTHVLSYYKVIERVDRILTEPTGLESTSLVLALGLDLFGSRVAPSKSYDMLDPNFNYALLTFVLVAMSAAVVISSKMVASKRLKDQWA